MGMFGSILGKVLGGLGSIVAPIPGVNGAEIGGAIGGLAPFKTGGLVKGKKGRAVIIRAHGGEFVLPANAKPTKAQRAIVAANKRRAKKGKR